jgi:hypothetical protein
MDSVCINIDDSRGRKRYRFTTSFESAAYGERAVVATFGALLHDYLRHPESKSLAPNGESCRRQTIGLLQRAHIIGGKHRRIGKEVDRRWEEGDDLDAIRQRPIEYQAIRAKTGDATAIPGGALSRLVKKIGLRKLMRQGLGRRILQKIWRQEPVKVSTLREYDVQSGNSHLRPGEGKAHACDNALISTVIKQDSCVLAQRRQIMKYNLRITPWRVS